MKNFKAFYSANSTLAGIEVAHIAHKEPLTNNRLMNNLYTLAG